jgi:hypothetical protein
MVHTRQAERTVSTGLDGERNSNSHRFFLWFGLRQFRKTERSFADLISGQSPVVHPFIRYAEAEVKTGGNILPV